MMDENGKYQYGIDGRTAFGMSWGVDCSLGTVWFHYQENVGLTDITIGKSEDGVGDLLIVGKGKDSIEALRLLAVAIDKALKEIPQKNKALGFD